MLNQILVFPRACLEAPEAISMRCDNKTWYLISISSTREEIPSLAELASLEEYGCAGYITLSFGDLTSEDYYKIRKLYPRIDLFSTEDANQILDFISCIRNLTEPSSLVVHCDAGISRSGAVGDFLCDYLDLDRDKFDRENSILPNSYVISILRRVAGLAAV